MSQYIVSARKYRPSTFKSVVGQSHVTDTLIHSLQTNQVAHAYLFCGPRGVGKTTVARILAKAINCENKRKDGEACDECPSCKSFNVNSSFNVFELDAASNNSVENIRNLVDQVRVPPAQGAFKVYIIDEVHMLSTAAFNAFLKTLEEPPPYVKFILATTEKHKILPTILSRCQAFDFRRIPVPEIAAHLREICDEEKIKAEQEALMIISQKGDGSLRDSLSIFDRIANQSRGNITYQGVLDNLQLLDYDYFFKITDALLREDLTQIFLLLAEIQKSGFEGEAFLSGFAEHLRDILLCKDMATAALLTHGEKIKSRYLDQAHAIPKSSLVTYLDLLNECEIHYDRALNKWLHLEMALVRMCYSHRKHQVDTDGDQKKKSSPQLTKSNQTPEQQSEIDKSEPLSTKPIQKPLVEIPIVKANGNGADTKAIPKLGIQNLRKEAEATIQAARQQTPVLTLQGVVSLWNEYAEKHTSPSLRQTMQESILNVHHESQLEIKTGNQTGKNRILAETQLIEALRELARRPDFKMNVVIDPELDKSREIAKPKKLLSNKEKYEILASKNPLIQTLREKLDLIPDQDE